MRRAAVALAVGCLVLGGLTLSAEAGGWYRGHGGYYGRHGGYYGHRGYYGRHGYYGYYGRSGYFLGGYLAGAASVLVLDALVAPRVVYGPPVYYGPPVVYGPPVGYAPPVAYGPVYSRVPACRNVWIPEHYEQQARTQNGFTQYYQVRVPGSWQQQCY